MSGKEEKKKKESKMVTIKKNENLWSVKSPYTPDFVRFARNQGAKWNADEKTWTKASVSYESHTLIATKF